MSLLSLSWLAANLGGQLACQQSLALESLEVLQRIPVELQVE